MVRFARNTATPPRRCPSARPWLMLVDDDQISAMAVRRKLGSLNMDVPLVHAIDGVDAMDHLLMSGQPRPSVMLIDLYMPRMGGLDLMHCLETLPGRELIQVHMMTSSDTPKHLCADYADSIAGFVFKDRSFQGLPEALAHLEPAQSAMV